MSKTRMEFSTFYNIGLPVLEPLTDADLVHYKKMALFLKQSNFDKQTAMLLALKYCFLQIMPPLASLPSSCINDVFLDLEPVKECQDPVLVIEGKHGAFCFRLEEILSLFHNDLSRSVVEYEPTYKVFSVMKTFRLPTHPYTGGPFTLQELGQLINQIVVAFDKLPLRCFEVYVFLSHARQMHQECQGKSNYEVTTALETFFEGRAMRYIEKFNKKTKDNFSHWNAKFPLRVANEKQLYLWFLKDVFLPFQRHK